MSKGTGFENDEEAPTHTRTRATGARNVTSKGVEQNSAP